MRAIVLTAAGLAVSCGGSPHTQPQQSAGPANVTVSIAVSGPGTVKAAGTDCRSTCQALAAVGTTFHLEAVSDAGARFDGWSGACSGSGACDLVLSADATVGAAFSTVKPPPPTVKHTLTVTVSGDGAVTSSPAGIACPGTCSASFDEGTKVDLTASANAGSDFSGWTGACAGAGACSPTMSTDLSVQASFAAKAAISVAISPAQVTLAPGATQRFTATVSGSTDTAVSWSADAGSVDSTGIYTAPQAAGTYRVVAASHADPSRTAAATVTVVPPTSSALTTCGSITSSGTFSVTGDLLSSGVCLDIHDVKSVTLDCGGHTVSGSPALHMSNVDGFSITNCKFASTARYYVAFLVQISNGRFQHDAFGTMVVDVAQATGVQFDQNTFTGAYQQYYSQRVTISNNTLVNQAGEPEAAMIISVFGSNNQITGNVVDGKWIGSGQGQADDGIVIEDESGDTIAGNSMSNFFDCGIETGGVVANTTFSNNTIAHTGFCGIGGWYWNSLRGCTISGNTADSVPHLFEFFRFFGLRPAGFDSAGKMPADTAVYFSDNVFDGNRIVNGPYASLIPVYSHMNYNGQVSNTPGERVPANSDFVLTNNTFRNDDFGHSQIAPNFGSPVVPGIIIDGGGNICSDGGAGYPLVCH